MTIEQKNYRIVKLINELSYKPIDKEAEEIYNYLKEIYKEDYRHSYHIIFRTLAEINERDKEKKMNGHSFDLITMNLEILNNYIYNKKSCDCKKGFNKLNDHIRLDIGRIRYMEAIEKSSQEDKISFSNKIKELTSKNEENRKIMERKLSDTEKDYITILGIFSSIILTVVAGITFSNAVLSNIHKSSIYKTIISILLLGFVIINLLYVMYLYVYTSYYDREYLNPKEEKIDILKKILVNNEQNYNKIDENRSGKKRVKGNRDIVSSHIKKINITIFCLMIITFVLWFIDIKSLRDLFLQKMYYN